MLWCWPPGIPSSLHMGHYGDLWYHCFRTCPFQTTWPRDLFLYFYFVPTSRGLRVYIVFFFLSVWTRVSRQLDGDGTDGRAMWPNVDFFLHS
jgi:hypothetical protein